MLSLPKAWPNSELLLDLLGSGHETQIPPTPHYLLDEKEIFTTVTSAPTDLGNLETIQHPPTPPPR